MTCSGEGEVLIATAQYGQYAQTCDTECCEPDPANDCFESLDEYDAEEWGNLKLACNYQADCNFQHKLHAMTTCPQLKDADYLMISYVCSNGNIFSIILVSLFSLEQG